MRDNISMNWNSKLCFLIKINCKWSCYCGSMRFYVFSWIFPFPQPRYCDKQCHQPTKHIILMEHIHHLEGIYGLLVDSSLWYLPSSITLYVNHFQSKVIWKLLNQTDITYSSNNVNCLQNGLLQLLQISTVLLLF